uniref:DUF7467 domain-containing protein n=1 Tax=Neptunomonas sp. TaxID=1971898 RepID=UPI0035697AEA
LQSSAYHTSCSQPINIGDVVGNTTLVGYLGEDGEANPTGSNNGLGEDADTGPGPAATFGSTVEFNYVVTNTGSTALGQIELSDDRISGLTFVGGDDDSDNLLDVGEEWLFTGSETAVSGQITNIGTVTGTAVDENGVSLNVPTVTDSDPGNYVVVGGPSIDVEKYVKVEGGGVPYEAMVCDTYGKALAMTFRYLEGSTVDTDQDSGKAYIDKDLGTDGDGVSYVIVSDKSSPTDLGGKVYFQGEVAKGADFTALGASSFSSSTYIHYFDDNPFDGEGSNALLQSSAYHTSCSQPINIGDVVGNTTLVGYLGEDGEANPTGSNDGLGEDADVGPGPAATFGSTVEFNYVVTNTGSVDLADVQVTDDRLANVTYVSGDDGDKILQVGEEWLYTASETAVSGQVTNIGTVTGTAVDKNGDSLNVPTVTDSDPGNYVVVGGPSIDVEKYVKVEGGGIPTEALVCETYGKAQEITFRYIDSSTVSNTQEGKAYIIEDGRADGDGVSYVIVSDKEKPLDSKAKLYFAGEVAVGADFVASAANAGADKFGSGTFIHFFDDNPFDNAGTELLQSAAYHTSCSKPINLGDVVGDVTLVGYTGENGTANPVNSGLGEDADNGPGPNAAFGSDVVFNYVVTNTGSGALSNVELTDDRIENLTFVGGDDGIKGLLEVGEEWLYTATVKAEAGVVGNFATVTATDDATGSIEVFDEDAAYYHGDSIDLSNVERLESSSTASQTSLSSLDIGMEEQTEFAYEGVTDAFDALDIPDMTVLGTADEQQVA